MTLDIKPLTALRFLAAIWVVSFLYWPSLGNLAAPMLVQKGYLGVEMFFVLSGFILSHVYLQGFGEGRFSYAKFLWARIARIYPLHLAVLLGLIGLVMAGRAAGLQMGEELVNWQALPANLLLLHAWGLAPAAAFNHPSWSISAEWFAYLSFPAFAWAAWRLKDRPSMAVIGSLIVMFGIYAVFENLAGFPLTEATFHWGALRIVPCFAYGCAVYLLWRSEALKTRTDALFWSGAFLVLWLALAQIGAPDGAMVTVAGGIILAFAGLTSTGSKALSNPVCVWLGEVSFAVYMVCFPWQLIFTKAADRILGLDGAPLTPLLWAVMFAGLLPVAAVAHHLVEKPCRTVLRRWFDARSKLSFAAAEAI